MTWSDTLSWVFRAEVLRVGEAVLVAVLGELDVATAAEFRELTDGIADPFVPPQVTVDLSRLDFVDAAGIAALVALRNEVHEVGGTVRVRSPRAHVRRVLELADVIDLLDAGSAPS